MLDIAFSSLDLPTSGALVLLAAEDGDRPALLRQADEATGGAVTRGLEAAEFGFGKNKSCVLVGPGIGQQARFSRIVLIGLGKLAEIDAASAERAGGSAYAALKSSTTAAIATDALPPGLGAHVAFGASLASYRFDRYRTKQKPDEKVRLTALSILGADRIAELAALGLEIEIFTPAQMEALGFGALLGVAMGSDSPARMAVMQWRGGPDPDAAPIAFVGKGVTFDSGGISIKPAGGMEDMKWDMAGAGTVVGLMAALAGRKAAVNAVGLVGLVENMLSGRAQRPGDVVTSASGQTIEVLNTDAEGRLVLADVLWYAQDRFKPCAMIDLATLTGAIIVALGHEHAGLFSNDDELATRLTAAGLATSEKLWRMPMGEGYDKGLRSEIADMKNIGGRPGGSITAAQFLKRFVGELPWAHLDIAGVAWSSKDQPCVPKGASAFGVRLLDRLVASHYEG
jgi:leucyl aminopeptidase